MGRPRTSLRVARLRAWAKWQRPTTRRRWISLDLDILSDPEVQELNAESFGSLIQVLICAGVNENIIPWKPSAIRQRTNAEFAPVLSSYLSEMDLFEFKSERGWGSFADADLYSRAEIAKMVKRAVAGRGTDPEPEPESESEPAERPEPEPAELPFWPITPNPEEERERTEEKTEKKKKPAKRREAKKKWDTPEARAGVDDQSEILKHSYGYNEGNLTRYQRLIDGGYSRDEWCMVLRAYAEGSTPSAKWAKSVGKIDWAMRPGEKGGFDVILDQARRGTIAPQEAAQPQSFPTGDEIRKASIEKWRKRREEGGA